MISSAIIIAYGSSFHESRLGYGRPRGMLPALGKPLVVRVLERLYRAGIRDYVVVVGQDDGAVAYHLKNSWLPDVNLEFVWCDQHTSLFKSLASIVRQHEGPFVIAGYNAITHLNFAERLLKRSESSPEQLVLSIAPVNLSRSLQQTYVSLNEQQEVVGLVRGPNFAGYFMLADLVVAGAEFVEFLKQAGNTRSFGRQWVDLVNSYIQSGHRAMVSETAWVLQVETDHDLLTLSRLLLDDQVDAHILSDIPADVQIIPPVRIDPRVTVGHQTVIGPYVYLESGCSVGARARLEQAVVLQGANIAASTHITDCIVASNGQVLRLS